MIILTVFVLYLFILIRPSHTKEADAKFNVDFAHRGLHGGEIPENSIAAFARAVDSGFGIELDLQLSRDGEVMVFHDYSLERMTGKKAKFSELSSSELSELRLAGTDEKIPRLREVLGIVNGRVPLLIELKGENYDTSLASMADEILFDYKGAYCVESFNPMFVGWYAAYRPKVYRGILYTNVCVERKFTLLNFLVTIMAVNFVAKPQFIAYDEKYRNSIPVKICTRFYKAAKFIWTIRDAESYSDAKASGVNVIFEDFIPPLSDGKTD